MKNALITTLGMGKKTVEILKKAGIRDTDSLLRLTDSEVLAIHGIGQRRFAEIVKRLKEKAEREAVNK